MKPTQAESIAAVQAGAASHGQLSASEPSTTTTARQRPRANAKSKPISTSSIEHDDFTDHHEDPIYLDLEPSGADSADTCIAKRMIDRMIADLAGEKEDVVADLFGHVDSERETRKWDALIWMYDLNPDGSDIPFTWACNEIGLDHEAFRRITARSVRIDLKRILKLLTGMVGFNYAKECEYKLADYVNLSGWNLH